MKECRHLNLLILNQSHVRLRCRFCHLTLKKDELNHGYCPECFDTTGKKHDDFEKIVLKREETVTYRCEDCGVILTPLNP
jgi:predicted RNA-binding Zn-ribbon protein involved in translation (DUF1610 family)